MKLNGKKVQLDDRLMHKKTKELLDSLNCTIPSNALMRDLSVANRQIIEIAKAVVKKARIIIMDEPTAAITVEEQKYLFENIRLLRMRELQLYTSPTDSRSFLKYVIGSKYYGMVNIYQHKP